MKKRFVHVLLLLCTVLIFFSCKKEKGFSAKEQYLIKAAWLYDQFGIDENLDGQIDTEEDIADCSKDDIITFNAGGTGSFDQGADLCFPDFPQSTPFEWRFLNNETQIEYAGTVHHILALNQTELRIYTEENNGNNTVRHILVFTH
jgi:hypothetical protein